METSETINKRAARVQSALDGAYGVRGKTLAVALRRTGRRMPKRFHTQAQQIVAAQALGGHPKLLRQVDGAALTAAQDSVVTYLDTIDRADRRKGLWLGIAGAIAFNILLVLIGFILWMVWAGQV